MRPSTPELKPRLASYVRACECDGQVILLNLHSGHYLGIGESNARALAEHVNDWPTNFANQDSGTSAGDIRVLIQHLMSLGLLTETSKVLPPLPRITEASKTMGINEESIDGRGAALLFPRFLQSAAVSAFWLRFRTLQGIATSVAHRRERREHIAAPPSLSAMCRGTSNYVRLRPLVFTAREKCLFDSLALLSFLAADGLFPQWVIGVKTKPFGAHAWVQTAETVLNDQHEYVRRFKPILVA
ncbi:lasso peptide biosynthesis B2 protein [Paucibacter sp. KBW04]|uniref:lasso peptide biosynthesis B2 protein n=1 Tax=Paucibacter sp. KBW04 TaxID=2153361 RepID=UPI000F5871F8|nr:lasso peptide biosynthesis B2 protein [Paucibacter sp. KBW04]RQO58050.1 lasso peptide biosynthesis B2 protein [Paucibacter sp. KBW04]